MKHNFQPNQREFQGQVEIFYFRQKTGKISFTTLGESFRKEKPRSAEAIELIPTISDAEELCEVISTVGP